MLYSYSASGASSPAQGRIAYARASNLLSPSKSVTQCLTRTADGPGPTGSDAASSRAAGSKVIGRETGETTRGQEGRRIGTDSMLALGRTTAAVR
jgi:hypothetical protein